MGGMASWIYRQLNRVRPVRIADNASVAAHEATRWTQVHAPWPTPWSGPVPPEIVGGKLPSLLHDRLPDTVMSAQGVLLLERASVLSDNGWIFTRRGRIAVGTTTYITDPRWMPRLHLPPLRIGATRLRGRTLSLLSSWAAMNFYHMLLEALPRIDLVFRAGWRWEDFDHVLLPAFSSPTVERLLAETGLPREKVRALAPHTWDYFRTDELVCTTFPGACAAVSPPSVDYLRRLYASATTNVPLKASAPPARRVFVRRLAKIRPLRNEEELADLAEQRGFTVIDPSQIPNAEDVFAAADVVVGAHGAGLANLTFCKPGTQVLELLPSAQAFPHYFTLAVVGGLSYSCLIGPSDVEHEPHHPMQLRNSPHPFVIEPTAFVEALGRIREVEQMPSR
jgi:capsular polysaccharide biosynthesis protein